MADHKTIDNSILEDIQNIPAVDPADLETNKGQTTENNPNSITIDNSKKTYGRGHNPNSKKNLISLADRTKEERIELGRKGGQKSAEIRRNRQTMKDTILELIQKEVKTEKYGGDSSILGDTATLQEIILASMIREASNGDTKAMQLLRDTIGEQPVTKTENRTEIITQEDLKTINNLKDYLTG